MTINRKSLRAWKERAEKAPYGKIQYIHVCIAAFLHTMVFLSLQGLGEGVTGSTQQFTPGIVVPGLEAFIQIRM